MRDNHYLLVGAVLLAVTMAGCMGGSGADINETLDDQANGSADAESDAETDGAADGSMDGGSESGTDAGAAVDGSEEASGSASAQMMGLESCEAGETMTFAELREQAEFQFGGEQSPDAGQVSGTVTSQGMVQHDGRQTCHLIVEYDETVGGETMQLERVEMWAGTDDYVDMEYVDASGTLRLRFTIEGNDTSTTLYDEQGDEIDIPSGGQMPSGDGMEGVESPDGGFGY